MTRKVLLLDLKEKTGKTGLWISALCKEVREDRERLFFAVSQDRESLLENLRAKVGPVVDAREFKNVLLQN